MKLVKYQLEHDNETRTKWLKGCFCNYGLIAFKISQQLKSLIFNQMIKN